MGISFFEDPIGFHKKHHTAFLIAETVLGICIMGILSFVFYEDTYALVEEDQWAWLSSSWSFSADGYSVVRLLPAILGLVELIGIFIVLFVRDKKGNPIFAKKMCHVLFFCTVGIGIVDLLFALFGGYMIPVDSSDYIVYRDYRLACWGSFVLQALLCLDFYVWRSEFGLEKFYGSGR